MELSPGHPAGKRKVAVSHRFLENVCTPELILCKSLVHIRYKDHRVNYMYRSICLYCGDHTRLLTCVNTLQIHSLSQPV